MHAGVRMRKNEKQRTWRAKLELKTQLSTNKSKGKPGKRFWAVKQKVETFFF